MTNIAILVEGKYVNPTKRDWYIDQVLLEDDILIDKLNKHGLSAEKMDWSKQRDLSAYRAVVFRSVWDYFHRIHEFNAFLKQVEGQTVFINPIRIIQWNLDKHYLSDLEKSGIPIVPSYFIEQGDNRSLMEIHNELGWKDTVIKPCISGAARHTYKLDATNMHQINDIYKKLILNESMMLQPFMQQIITKGEVSHIVIGGKYAHSVLKKAKVGDYRVQDDFGGSVHDYKASRDEIDFAEKAVQACHILPQYARVDVVWDNDDQLALGELELIEPELWFRNNPKSAEMLAQEVANLLKLEV